ncbi:30S ribosomal protein S6 [Deferribacteres bacterium DY0037]
MNTYETVFIVRPDLPQEELDKELEFYKGNIEQHGGKILKVEPWGKQTMAYDIENFREGVYFLIQFEASTEYHDELNLRFRYNENILRFVVVAIDEKKFKLNPKRDTSGPKRYGKKPSGPRKPREDAEQSETTEEKKVEAPAAETPAEAPAETPAPAETISEAPEAPAVETKEEETEKSAD